MMWIGVEDLGTGSFFFFTSLSGIIRAYFLQLRVHSTWAVHVLI